MKKTITIMVFTMLLVTMGWVAGRRYLHLAYMTLFIKAPPEKKFMEAWESDFKHLGDIKALPEGIRDLKQVKLSTPSQKLKEGFKHYPIAFNARPTGHYVLEIFADEIDGGGVVVQYDLVDTKSGNTIWELARTFPHKL